jgi:hypothetical protein
MNSGEMVRMAVDIGGTFIDVVVLCESGRRVTAKALTTPDDPERGVLDGRELAAREFGATGSELLGRAVAFVHGTTVGTNALVQRRGARTGLLMTRGHEQTIIIGRVRQKITGLSEREKIHVTHLHKADPPIVAPEDIRGVAERIDARGRVVVALDEAGARAAVNDLVGSGIEALAICFLFSFLEPSHEQRVAAGWILPSPKMIIIAVDVFFGYAAGVASWKALAVAFQVRAWSQPGGELTVRPLHPDGAAGLGAIGRLFFLLSLIFIFGGLFCRGWILHVRGRCRCPDWARAARYDGFEPWFAGGIAVLAIPSILAFVTPMLSLHRLMSERARQVNARWARLGLAMAELEDSTLVSPGSLKGEALDERLETLQTLRTVYAHRRRAPTWPVDLRTVAKLVGVQVSMWLGVALAATQLAEKAATLPAFFPRP